MGKLIITRRWVEERQLILTDEDWKLHDEPRGAAKALSTMNKLGYVNYPSRLKKR